MIKIIQMRSVARMEAFIIPPSLDISDSAEKHGQALQAKATTKRPRVSKSSAACKIIITTPRGRGDPRKSLSVDPLSAWRQAWEAKLQSSNIEPSTSQACMSPSKMRTASSTCTTSSLPAGGTAVDEDSDPIPDFVSSSLDGSDDGIMLNQAQDLSDNLNLPGGGGRRARHRIKRLRTDVSSPEGND